MIRAYATEGGLYEVASSRGNLRKNWPQVPIDTQTLGGPKAQLLSCLPPEPPPGGSR